MRCNLVERRDSGRFSDADGVLMRRAIELARLAIGRTSPNPMVGAILVKKGRVIGEGYHHEAGGPHAEIEAINNSSEDVADSTLYVTLEPCSHTGRTPPCVNTIIEKKIARVVAPIEDPNPLVGGKGFKQLRAAGIDVDVGLCAAEARRLNETFLVFHQLKRPFVTCKWAMTLDGRIATESGHARWITNDQSRNHVHELRGQVDAVMVGIGTVLLDNPQLNVRLEGFIGRQPKRVIVDGSLKIPLKAKCFEQSTPGQCVIATTATASEEKIGQLRDAGHQVLVLPGRRGLLDIKELMTELARLEIQSILCEGGSNMHGMVLKARVVDKVIAYIAPKVVGGDTAKGPVTGWSIPTMNRAMVLENVTYRQFEEDLYMEGYVPDSFRGPKSFTPPSGLKME